MQTFTVPDIAESLYRLYARITGAQTEWEFLPFPEQALWIKIARDGAKVLEKLGEGQTFARAGYEVFLCSWFPEDPDSENYYYNVLPPEARLAWEAVARYLFTLVDCDEVTTLSDLEQMWAEWYTKKAGTLLSSANKGV